MPDEPPKDAIADQGGQPSCHRPASSPSARARCRPDGISRRGPAARSPPDPRTSPYTWAPANRCSTTTVVGQGGDRAHDPGRDVGRSRGS